MFCSACGQQVSGGAAFCPHCGAKQEPVVLGETSFPGNVDSPPSGRQGRRSVRVAVIAAAVVVVCAGVGGAYFLLRNRFPAAEASGADIAASSEAQVATRSPDIPLWEDIPEEELSAIADASQQEGRSSVAESKPPEEKPPQGAEEQAEADGQLPDEALETAAADPQQEGDDRQAPADTPETPTQAAQQPTQAAGSGWDGSGFNPDRDYAAFEWIGSLAEIPPAGSSPLSFLPEVSGGWKGLRIADELTVMSVSVAAYDPAIHGTMEMGTNTVVQLNPSYRIGDGNEALKPTMGGGTYSASFGDGMIVFSSWEGVFWGKGGSQFGIFVPLGTGFNNTSASDFILVMR